METRMTIPEKPELPKVYVCHSLAWKYGHPPMVSYEAHSGYELHIPASRVEELEKEVEAREKLLHEQAAQHLDSEMLLIRERDRLKTALEKLDKEIEKAHDMDRDEFMRAPAGNPGNCWEAPSRHLQTFTWLRDQIRAALSEPAGGDKE